MKISLKYFSQVPPATTVGILQCLPKSVSCLSESTDLPTLGTLQLIGWDKSSEPEMASQHALQRVLKIISHGYAPNLENES